MPGHISSQDALGHPSLKQVAIILPESIEQARLLNYFKTLGKVELLLHCLSTVGNHARPISTTVIAILKTIVANVMTHRC